MIGETPEPEKPASPEAEAQTAGGGPVSSDALNLSEDELAELARFGRAVDAFMDDEAYAYALLPGIDYTSQQFAISQLLRRNAAAAERLSGEIDEIASARKKARGDYADHLVEEWVDAVRGSVFSDAAESMAAVGMIAPFLESVFVQAFAKLGELSAAAAGADWRPEGRRRTAVEAEFWNCRYYWTDKGERRDDIISGIIQLSTDTGLIEEMPADFKERLTAILTYRNLMFHNGFEWPEDRRKSFKRLIEDRGWPNWFRYSESGDSPWIFYLTKEFLEGWPSALLEIVEGIGRFARKRSEAARGN